MYGVVLFLHSWVRWGVLALGVLTWARSVAGVRAGRVWAVRDDRLEAAMVGVADLQLLLGLTLWLVASPLTHLAFSERLLFSGAHFTFFALFHPVVMLGALLFLHAQRARQQKQPSLRRWRDTMLVFLGLVGLAVPWPFWSFGRELCRGLP